MRFATIASLSALLSLSLSAQHVTNANPSGFGSVLYPGTGLPPASAHGAFGSVLFPGTGAPGARVPVTRIPGSSSLHRVLPPPPSHQPHGRAIIVPYPVYYGGYSYGDPEPNFTQQPAPAYDYGLADAPPGQAPVVILNQGRPVPDYRDENPSREYAASEPAPDRPATIYLLARADHTIIPAIAYWVEADTLTYITTEGVLNHVSLSLIDRDFSKQLNASRNVEFSLPAHTSETKP